MRGISRSSLYYTPRGESAESLALMRRGACGVSLRTTEDGPIAVGVALHEPVVAPANLGRGGYRVIGGLNVSARGAVDLPGLWTPASRHAASGLGRVRLNYTGDQPCYLFYGDHAQLSRRLDCANRATDLL